MTPAEIEHELKEVENRLERVRALYEQYFMGIERLEPTIARKDLERRMHTLRKTPFQNTAKRFKFQTTVQRYNTLQQYWNRTCRDIENGTYTKHLKRAQRRFGAHANEETSPQAKKEDAQERAAQAANARDDAAADLAALLDADVDPEKELKGALSAMEKTPQKQTQTGVLGKLGTKETSHGQSQRTRTSPKPTLGKLPTRRGSSEATPTPERLSTRKSPKPKGLNALNTSPSKRAAAKPAIAGAPPPAPSSKERGKTSTAVKSLGALSPRSAAQTSLGRTQAPHKAPTQPTALTQNAAAPQREKPKTRPITPRPTPSGGSAALSDDRIRTLHKTYVDARKKTNAGSISFEKLEKSIRETEKKLRATHKGRNVDFDVKIQGGKAILKPKLK